MNRELKIVITSKFIHPHLGTEDTTYQEFEMKDGEAARDQYLKEFEAARKSGGCYAVQITIQTKYSSQ